MPELPEVESTVAYLRSRLGNAVVRDVHVAWGRSVAVPTTARFVTDLKGARFIRFFRRAKYVGMAVRRSGEKESHLLFHMRMTGSFDVVAGGEPALPHDRITFFLQDGRELRFHDPRKFGRAYLVPHMSVITAKLGYEPLDQEFGIEQLRALVADKRGSLKTFLLDQRRIAGIGNIYADEILWHARLHPKAAPKDLSARQLKKLHAAIGRVLREAIEKSGTDFGDGVVEMGGYRPRAYGRDELPCRRCGAPIRRIVISQRSTHFCPRCQRIRS